jgi:hypothetical protein
MQAGQRVGFSCREKDYILAQPTQGAKFSPKKDMSLAWEFWNQVTEPWGHPTLYSKSVPSDPIDFCHECNENDCCSALIVQRV